MEHKDSEGDLLVNSVDTLKRDMVKSEFSLLSGANTSGLHNGCALHLLTSLDFGGVESQIAVIADNVGFSNYNRTFCAIGGGGAVMEHLKATGAEATTLNKPVRIPSLPAIIALWRHLRRIKPDVLHLHGAEANFHGAIAGRLAGVPVIIAEEIGIPDHSPRARRIFAWVYRRCDRIIAVSEAVKARIVEMGEAVPEQIDVVYIPFVPQKMRQAPEMDGKIRLGFVGRLEPVKNPLAAAEAVNLLRKSGHDVSLRIIGNGSLKGELERRITSLGLSEHVELCGFLSAPFDALRDCHLYLQPSLSEGLPLAIREAMSFGIPVIATEAGGTSEVITHSETGWLVPSPEPQALADTVEAAMALGPEALGRIAVRARESVIRRFGVETYLQRLDDLYDSLRTGA